TKQLQSDEFAVVGFTAPRGARSGFGSLLLARPDPEHGWRYAGKVGSGFKEAQLGELATRLGQGARKPTVYVDVDDPDLRRAAWIEPELVVEVFYRGIGAQQVLRQPSLKALRPDKTAADLADSDRGPASRKARAAKATRTTKVTRAASGKARKAGKTAHDARRQDVPAREPPRLSSPGKVLYPDDGYTKAEVWNYYQAVMDHLLPEIAGRPVSIIRCPSGTGRPCFFQKHHTPGLERVSSVRLKEESGTNAYYLVVEDAAGLLELVQFNALEFHPWGSHADAPDMADRVVFDLDPGPEVPFAEVKRAASDVRRLLAQLELESFLRVSGGKGLHVVVPLNPGCDWELTKRFAHGFADALAQSQPDRFLAVASKRLRNRRIFVDYLRNGRGATAVASYSLRARPGAPVAMPIAWSELSRLKRPDAFTLAEVPARLRRRRRDPWEGIGTIRQNLARWARQTE
ncbi:MAG TPA: DNA ligase D, partial [Pseudoxanthomonas sp.]|nr:DNA ligase D [Pseudoxanthomonas sp.]